MKDLRQAVGLRSLAGAYTLRAESAELVLTGSEVNLIHKKKLPTFKQYRENGKFYFKLLDDDGRVLVQSAGFDSAKDVGNLIAKLKGIEDEVITIGPEIIIMDIEMPDFMENRPTRPDQLPEIQEIITSSKKGIGLGAWAITAAEIKRKYSIDMVKAGYLSEGATSGDLVAAITKIKTADEKA